MKHEEKDLYSFACVKLWSSSISRKIEDHKPKVGGMSKISSCSKCNFARIHIRDSIDRGAETNWQKIIKFNGEKVNVRILNPIVGNWCTSKRCRWVIIAWRKHKWTKSKSVFLYETKNQSFITEEIAYCLTFKQFVLSRQSRFSRSMTEYPLWCS